MGVRVWTLRTACLGVGDVAGGTVGNSGVVCGLHGIVAAWCLDVLGEAMTKDQEAMQAAMRELGCIVCYLFGTPGTPASIHHILSGGRRIGEDDVLPLCHPHHQGGFCGPEIFSRHPYRRAFEQAYGTEKALLENVLELIGETA